ncbi:MAG: DUF4465 domain-containing protein [Bacteroidota bacterium]
MKQFLLSILTLTLSISLGAQVTADFENFGLTAGEKIFNAENDVFESGNVSLVNVYNEAGMFWSGWAISADTDTETPGFANQYSAKPGTGAEGSTSYALTYAFFPTTIDLTGEAAGEPVEGMHVTNNTYAFTSVRDGDSFANKFGGESGNDPDFFLLTVKGILDGEITTDSVDFYLADYRFEDNSMDYIVDDWNYVDLTSLGNVDQLQIILRSSDTGANGMNTPAYVCVDNIVTAGTPVRTQEEQLDWQVQLAPNPTQDRLVVNWPVAEAGRFQLFNAVGQQVLGGDLQLGQNELSLAQFPAGIYQLYYRTAEQWNVTRVVRQ